MKSEIKFFILFLWCFSHSAISQLNNRNFNSFIISPVNQIENSPKGKSDIMLKINAVGSSKTKLQNNISWSPVKHIMLNSNIELGYDIRSFSISTGWYNTFKSKNDSIKLKVVSINAGYNLCPSIENNTKNLTAFSGNYSRIFAQLNYQVYKQSKMYLFGVSGHAYDWKKISYSIDSNKRLIQDIIANDPLFALYGHIKYGIIYSNVTLEFGLNILMDESSSLINYYKFNVTSGFSIDLH